LGVEGRLEAILDEFPVDVSSTQVLDVPGLDDASYAILNILRGSSGYRVSGAFPSDTPVVSVRTEYSEDGYRAHSDDSRRARVTYSDLDPRGLRASSTLIIPDTFATGRSAEAALTHLLGEGIEPERVVLYGFTAIPALERLGLLCAGWGVELVSFSICDVTQPWYDGLHGGIAEAELGLLRETLWGYS
jgi:hypothetical protein